MAEDLLSILRQFHREVALPDFDERIGQLREENAAHRRELLAHFDELYRRFDRLESE